jgi:GNAT superfamily N-acetyltransferase
MTAALDLNVRLMRDDDVDAVAQLLQDTFDGWPKVPTSAAPIDHLRWKLGEGRPGHRSHFVAEIDGRIIAFQLNLHWHMKVGDRVLEVRRGGDAGVHPDYQGKGVMSIMRPAMHERFEVVPDMFLGASTHAAFVRLFGQEDRRQFAHRWLVYIRPLTLGAALKTFKIRRGRPRKKLVASFKKLARWMDMGMRHPFAFRPDTGISIHTAPSFDERIDSFCEDALTPFDFASIRTKELLNWRFADARAGQFTIRMATEEGRIVGYSVLRIANGRGHIADLLVQPNRPVVTNALARDAIAELRPRVSTIECWLFDNSPYLTPLEACGFVGTRHRRQLTYEAVGVPVEEVEFLSGQSIKAHLSLGDMDWV